MEPVHLFLREKPANALLAVGELDPAYAAMVAKRIDSTPSHTLAILGALEKEGLIESRLEGRVRLLFLTDQGRRVESALRGLIDVLGDKIEGQEEQNVATVKLERIESLIETHKSSPDKTFQLGPLRRDLAILMRDGGQLVSEKAKRLDSNILEYLRK